MTYLWAYGEVLNEVSCERPLILDTSYEVDLWHDNPTPTRWHEVLDSTMNSRTYTCARLRLAKVWMDRYYRRCRQMPGRRSRGPVQEYRILNNSGHQYVGHPQRFAFGSWKSHRHHQYRA